VLPFPPKYYEQLSSAVQPKPGNTWKEIEYIRAKSNSRTFSNTPEKLELRKQREGEQRQYAAESRALISTYSTWEQFQQLVLQRKGQQDLHTAQQLYQRLGNNFIKGLFHLLYLA